MLKGLFGRLLVGCFLLTTLASLLLMQLHRWGRDPAGALRGSVVPMLILGYLGWREWRIWNDPGFAERQLAHQQTPWFRARKAALIYFLAILGLPVLAAIALPHDALTTRQAEYLGVGLLYAMFFGMPLVMLVSYVVLKLRR